MTLQERIKPANSFSCPFCNKLMAHDYCGHRCPFNYCILTIPYYLNDVIVVGEYATIDGDIFGYEHDAYRIRNILSTQETFVELCSYNDDTCFPPIPLVELTTSNLKELLKRFEDLESFM